MRTVSSPCSRWKAVPTYSRSAENSANFRHSFHGNAPGVSRVSWFNQCNTVSKKDPAATTAGLITTATHAQTAQAVSGRISGAAPPRKKTKTPKKSPCSGKYRRIPTARRHSSQNGLRCNSTQSRNYSLGLHLGQGANVNQIMSNRSSVAEGYYTAQAVHL